MNPKRPLRDEGPATSQSSLKRPRVLHGGSPAHYKARHEDYTIAWICALHLELAASRAMLDDEHQLLPIEPGDENTYVLGHIDQHNIVMACLPGHYGTNNAAIVATNLKRSFPNILATLMVGIGGGSPSQADLYLGDVVVGTRVMQYDMGKVTVDGQFQETAEAKTPAPLLNSAVSNLRSKHELHRSSSRMTSLVQSRLPSHVRPSQPDRLFQSTYEHPLGASSCDKCDPRRLQPRRRRLSDQPRIHYGVIASGNRVMKNGKARDDIAQRNSALCFEMEAAGMMDNLRCLPIRGICDYSDSHKGKEWQSYAAATAAAYARELLEVLPPSGELGWAGTYSANASPGSRIDDDASGRRQLLLQSLDFPQIDARKTNIGAAHAKTCCWLLSHPAYRQWLEPAMQSQNLGFLWMRGKAGAGKSTMMKFAYLETKKKHRNPSTVVASFFFNARGDYLEKSITGMYRSLLMQLFRSFSDLQLSLDDTDIVPRSQQNCPDLNALKELLKTAVMALDRRSLTCFIDALDECDEQEVRDMIQFFEDLAENTTADGIRFRICFSSRPYPYIDIRKGILLTLEDELGHADDLAQYVKSHLRINNPTLLADLQSQILAKAAGIFMWIVLVVEILNKESIGGALAMKTRLSEIPPKLSDLFRSMLKRDQDRAGWLLLCVLWILCAKRPLNPAEFRHALWAGLLEQRDQVDPELPDVTDMDDCVRLVTSSSKGLAEITKSKRPTVQFIHESVRDFLVKEKGLQDLWPDCGFEWEGRSHDRLRRCCTAYLHHPSVRAVISGLEGEEGDPNATAGNCSFLEYASQQVLHHADAAALVISQNGFLSQFFASGAIVVTNLFERFKSRRYGLDATPLYVLADKGLGNLIRTWTKQDSNTYVPGERYGFPLFAALANGRQDAVAALLDLPSTAHNGIDITKGLKYRKDLTGYKNRTPLSWAAQEGRLAIVKILIHGGANPDEADRERHTPLLRAIKSGHEVVAQFLIDKGADIHATNSNGSTALILALENRHEAVARLLIDKGADIYATNSNRSTALILALENGHEAVVRLLINKGADIYTTNSNGSTALILASEKGYEAVAQLLIDKGADIHATNSNGSTALILASEKGYKAIAQLLIDKGADIYATNSNGSTALILASEKGYEAVAQLLIDKGADIHAINSNRSTVLILASEKGYEAVARLLIDKGADIHATNSNGLTALILALENGHEAVARLLIDKGADIHATNSNRLIALIQASEKGYEAVARLLIDNGADINAKNEYGWTALIVASEKGHEAVVRLLIDNGADINAKNEYGWTALILASYNGHEAVARLLIDKGADIHATNSNGSTALILALENGYKAVARLLIDNRADINAKKDNGLTALILASYNGHEAMARLLIDKGADINAKNKYGWTALIVASENGHEAVARLLIGQGADINTTNSNGSTALIRASEKGYKAVVRLLIDKGADIYATNSNGSTALILASEKGYEAVAQLLIDKGADIHATNSNGSTALILALENRHEAMVQLLISQGADINTTNSNGSTALIRASENGHEVMVQLLIGQGADINTTNSNGSTALIRASEKGYEAVARLLIDKGADIYATNSNGSTALILASEKGYEAVAQLLIDKGADIHATNSNGLTALILASYNGHEAVARLLIDNGADINAKKDNGLTALILASYNGYEAVARLLINQGADINTKNKYRWTALIVASEKGHEAMVQLLIDKGADIYATNDYGSTALILASYNGHEAVARLLIDKGADIHATNDYGSTALILASYNGYEAVARLLIDKGADIHATNSNGSTALILASYNGHEAVARLLIDKGADINANDNYRSTALIVPSQNRHGAVGCLLKGVQREEEN